MSLKTDLEEFLLAHKRIDFPDHQESIVCLDCGAHLPFPLGTGVNVVPVEGQPDVDACAYIEVPSSIAGGHITYVVDLLERTVSL